MLMLAGVVHGVDLGHAVSQVAEETRSDFGVDSLAGGQEAGDFIHALAETGAVFSQNSGVGVQGSCTETKHVYLNSCFFSHAHALFRQCSFLKKLIKHRSQAGSPNQSKYFAPKRAAVKQMSRGTLLTGHLSSLKVPEMLHCHLQDVRLLQFGVSGALRRRKTRASLGITLNRHLTSGRWRAFEIY